MKKFISLLLIFAILMGFALTGCASAPTENESETVTVTDHSGNMVTLPKNIERVAVCDIYPLVPVLTVFFDSADKIVAISPSSMSAAENGILSEIYPEILNADTSAISGAEVNTEELMKLNPDVVFYNAATAQLGETLKKSGFNAVAVSVSKWDYNPVETLNQWLELLSAIFPEAANDKASLVKNYSEETVDFVKERTKDIPENERKNIMFLLQYSENAIVSTGLKSFGQWWADSIGAFNSATELQDANSSKVTLEQIYSWNPDLILMTNFTTAFPEDLFNGNVGNYDWSGITAVQNGEVYKMPLGMYRSYTPGIDTPVTVLWIAKTVYPDAFADIDIAEKTAEYYKNVFGVELSSEQAGSIFTPAGEAGKTYN